MAHEINRMVYAGEVPWHGIGVQLPRPERNVMAALLRLLKHPVVKAIAVAVVTVIAREFRKTNK